MTLLCVEQHVGVTVDESKFTPEFMEEFRRYFYPFDSLDDHMAYLAKVYVAGEAGPGTTFIEGYGNPADFGIKWEEESEMFAVEAD